MAWFPLMLTFFLAFPALHRRRRILQSPRAASIRNPEDDRVHPPPLLILRPLLPRPVVPRSAWIPWAAALRSALKAVADSGSEAAWVELLILPMCVLSARRRPRATAPPRPLDDAALAARVLRKVADGHLSAAVRMLEPATIAPATPDTCAALAALHPIRPLPVGAPPAQAPYRAQVEEVLAALKTFPPGGSDLLLDSLLGVVNRALAGDVPPPLRSYWLVVDRACNDRDSYPGLRGPSEESYQLGRVCHVPKRPQSSSIVPGNGELVDGPRAHTRGWWLHLDGFPLGFVNETRAGLIVLGAAVTVSVEYAASVAQAHVDAVAASLQRLPILRHPQAELLLLRSCLGTCKVVFTARTMPPAAAAQALVTFDMLQTQVLQSIVTAGGGGFGPLQQTLAGLPIAQGGLGVTKATSLLPCAYLASVTQTAPLQDRLLGTSTAPLVPAALAAKADYCALVPDFDAALFEDPDFVRSKVQARLSKPLSHRAYQEVLDDPARSDRDRAVLQSLTQPGASDWLLALPVPHLQQTMPPESFRCRLQYQLLIPIFHPGSQCPCCLRELDVWGDHAVHCTSGGDVAIVGRHYSVRNGLDAVLTSARQRVTREPAFPTPVPGQERRRADLRLHAWEEGRDLYIDIVGSSPLTVANLLHFVPGGAAARAAQDKQTRYAVLLSRQQPPVAFQAFAFETLGGLHADALALLQRLQGLLNQAIIAQEDVEGYFVIRRVSFIIAAAVGRQLAARRV
eukprot:jgi/Botrbrau1/2022/Bobra.0047s0006.1